MIQPSNFIPAWWLKNPHAQTIWAGLLRRRPCVIVSNERITLADGDFIDLALTRDNQGPVVLLLHGLQGSLQSYYAGGMLHALQQGGYCGVLMHFRSCSGELNRRARLYHSGETADPKYVVDYLQHRFPGRPLAAIGFSLGGNVLLKLLGEQGAQSHLKAAVAVSVPMRLDYCADRMNQGLSRLYQWNLIRSLKRTAKSKYRQGQLPGLNIGKILNSHSFWEIDDAFVAPLHGFKDVHDYYQQSSSRQYLQHIQIPTLIIQAKDDPFTSEKVIPRQSELSDSVQLEISERGGHVGFVGGRWPWRAHYWLEQRVPQFLKQHLIS